MLVTETPSEGICMGGLGDQDPGRSRLPAGAQHLGTVPALKQVPTAPKPACGAPPCFPWEHHTHSLGDDHQVEM
jgi:hypothetical protein